MEQAAGAGEALSRKREAARKGGRAEKLVPDNPGLD